jgi:hypothetical protein
MEIRQLGASGLQAVGFRLSAEEIERLDEASAWQER